MGGVLAAYLSTVAIVTYRWVKGPGEAPPPVALTAAGGVFGLIALAGRADARLGNALGWGVVLATYFVGNANGTLAPINLAKKVAAPASSTTAATKPKPHPVTGSGPAPSGGKVKPQ